MTRPGAKAAAADVVTCQLPKCRRPIAPEDLRAAVKVSSGYMHAECHRENVRIVAELLRPRDGAVPWTTMCEGCREWVGEIWHVHFGGRRICLACAVAGGVDGAKEAMERRGIEAERRAAAEAADPGMRTQ